MENLSGIMNGIDVKTNKEYHKEANEAVTETKEEIENWFTDQLVSEQKESVRIAYNQALEQDILDFCHKKPMGLDEYPDEVNNINQRLLDILRNPEAQSLADRVDKWFINADIDVLDSDERNSLIEIFKSDIDGCKNEIEQIIQSHNSLQDMLPIKNRQVNQLLRNAITESSSISDLRSIREQLEMIVPLWSYPWTIDSQYEVATAIETEVKLILEEHIKEVVTRSDNFRQLTTVINEKFSEGSKHLDDIRKGWSRVEREIRQLNDLEEINSIPVAIETRAQSAAENASSIQSLVNEINDLESDVSILYDMASVSLDRFHPTADVSSSSFINTAELITEYESAHEIRKSSLAAETSSKITHIKPEFDKHVTNARDIMEQTENSLRSKINSVRKLAQNFDLRDDSDKLSDILSDLSKTNKIDDYINISNRSGSLFKKIQTKIKTERLAELELVVFEWLTDQSDNPHEIVDNLEAIRTVQSYPWNLDSNQTGIKMIEDWVNDMIGDVLKSLLEQLESPDELVTLIDEKFESVGKSLSQLEQIGIVCKVEALSDTEIVEDPLRPANLRIRNALDNAGSLRNLIKRLEDVAESICMLNDIASRSLDKFISRTDEVPDNLESEVLDLHDQYQKAIDIREEVFNLDAPELPTAHNEFENHIDNAKNILEKLQKKTRQKIRLSEELAREFELKGELKQLDRISKKFVNVSTVKDTIRTYSKVIDVYDQIQEIVHDTLSSTQKGILEWIIRRDDDVVLNSDVQRELATEFGCEETEIVDHFLSLQEDGFLDFIIKKP